MEGRLAERSRCRLATTSNPAAMQNGKLTEAKRMAAGFCAGITEALIIVTPFEVVKIRLQQQRGLTKELLKYRVC